MDIDVQEAANLDATFGCIRISVETIESYIDLLDNVYDTDIIDKLIDELDSYCDLLDYEQKVKFAKMVITEKKNALGDIPNHVWISFFEYLKFNWTLWLSNCLPNGINRLLGYIKSVVTLINYVCISTYTTFTIHVRKDDFNEALYTMFNHDEFNMKRIMLSCMSHPGPINDDVVRVLFPCWAKYTIKKYIDEWTKRVSQQSIHREFTGVQRRILLLQVWKIYTRISILTLSGEIFSLPEESIQFELIRPSQPMTSFDIDDLDACDNHINEWYEDSLILLDTIYI